jgi:predicted NBD/HSP70 family sugar kinase
MMPPIGGVRSETRVLVVGVDIGGSSVKVAALRDGAVVRTGRSETYRQPGREALARAIVEAIVQLGQERVDAVGMCVPGLLDDARQRVTHSVNIPSLAGVRLADLLAGAGTADAPRVFSDANAAAWDVYASRKLTGRLLTLVLGTGVGAAVVDEAGVLRVDGDSPGHLGQCDVSIEGEPVIGPDGGAGSLEGYLSTAALMSRYGSVDAALRQMRAGDAPIRALARVIRIAHAIYRPHHVCLAGGIGIRMTHLLAELRATTDEHLTRIARPGWTLTVGDSDFHAAIGAARLAAASVGSSSGGGDERQDAKTPRPPR